MVETVCNGCICNNSWITGFLRVVTPSPGPLRGSPRWRPVRCADTRGARPKPHKIAAKKASASGRDGHLSILGLRLFARSNLLLTVSSPPLPAGSPAAPWAAPWGCPEPAGLPIPLRTLRRDRSRNRKGQRGPGPSGTGFGPRGSGMTGARRSRRGRGKFKPIRSSARPATSTALPPRTCRQHLPCLFARALHVRCFAGRALTGRQKQGVHSLYSASRKKLISAVGSRGYVESVF